MCFSHSFGHVILLSSLLRVFLPRVSSNGVLEKGLSLSRAMSFSSAARKLVFNFLRWKLARDGGGNLEAAALCGAS